MEKNKPFHLIETFSGRTIARAHIMEDLKSELSEKFAPHYTVHSETEGWFAPASILFKKELTGGTDGS